MSFVSFREGTLPETNSSPLKIDPWKREISIGNHHFLGAMLVSGRVTQISI